MSVDLAIEEMTDDDYEAIAVWTWGDYQEMWQAHLCGLAATEERWSNYMAGCGYVLTVHIA